MNIQEIKKAILEKNVRLSNHTLEMLIARGYLKKDILACIWSAISIEHQNFSGKKRVKVSGYDSNGQSIVVILAHDQRNQNGLCVVTVFVPTKQKIIARISHKILVG